MNSKISASTSSISFNASTKCSHCGLPVKERYTLDINDDKTLQENEEFKNAVFCCNGCRYVYQVIHNLGLSNFYQIKNQLGGVNNDYQPPSLESDYSYFDDSTFQQAYCTTVNQKDNSIVQVKFYLTNIHCAACIWLIEKLPQLVQAVVYTRVDFTEQTVRIKYIEKDVKLSTIAAKLASLGYPPHPMEESKILAEHKRETLNLISRIGVAALAAGNNMMNAIPEYQGYFTGIDSQFSHFFNWLSFILTLPAVVYSAYPFYRSAITALRAGNLHIDLPISLGILGGFIASLINLLQGRSHVYFDSVSMLIFLLLIARLIQRQGIRHAINTNDLLFALSPQSAKKIRSDGSMETVFTASLNKDDMVYIEAGEVISVDGIIKNGSTYIDASIISGESRPLKTLQGSQVYAGTTNLSHDVELQVTATHKNSRVGQLLSSINDAASKRPPIADITNSLSGYFVGGVLVLAMITGAYWLIASDVETAFEHVLAVLVVTCPCALGLAAPIGFSVALKNAAKSKIIFHSQEAIQRLAEIKQVFFDKTGTLTEGTLEAVKSYYLAPDSNILQPVDDLQKALFMKPLFLASELEKNSRHPIATAIRQIYQKFSPSTHSFSSLNLKKLKEYPGCGIAASSTTGDSLKIGSLNWLLKSNPDLPSNFQNIFKNITETALTPVGLLVNNRLVSVYGLGDTIKPDAKDVISRLKARGIKCGILSGDIPEVAKRLGHNLGLPENNIYAALSPEQKASIVRDQDDTTAMVGDGINDTLALSGAGVGICVSGGAEASLRSSDIFLARNNLSLLLVAIQGSINTMRLIKRNLTFSMSYNLIAGSLAFGGQISPLIAAILMPLSSLTVVLSSITSKPFTRSLNFKIHHLWK